MNYEGYKAIHRTSSKNWKIVVVEWPDGSVTVETNRRTGKLWGGGVTFLSKPAAKALLTLLRRAGVARADRRVRVRKLGCVLPDGRVLVAAGRSA